MLLSETDAKTKECRAVGPAVAISMTMASASLGAHAGAFATAVPITALTEPRLCVASACMMWRKHDQVGIGPNGEKRDRDMDGRTRWVDRGYCGLAGIPTKGFS